MKERPYSDKIPNRNSPESATMQAPEKSERDRELEIIERKLLAAKALIDEGLNRVKELKAA